jgi:hypothetical protein
MYTLMFMGYAAAQAALFVWLLRLWRGTRAPAAAVLLVPQLFLIWDNLRVAAGTLLGHGPLLYWLSWPAFWSHWLTGCWLIIATGSILRLADRRVGGLGFAQRRWVMGAFCLVAAALMLYDLPYFWTRDIHPACELGLIRYSGSVSEATRCFAGQPLVTNDFPLAPVVTCFVVIAGGALLWARDRFPWMALGAVAMLLTAALPALRAHKLDNFGEVLIVLGATLAIARYARATPRGAQPATAGPAPRDPLPG